MSHRKKLRRLWKVVFMISFVVIEEGFLVVVGRWGDGCLLKATLDDGLRDRRINGRQG
jgi:hypothetical protein